MANIIEMPKLSDTMTVGTLVKWLKKEGDSIKSGDMLAEIETDKATMELESFFDGTLLAVFVPAGSQVPLGAALCAIGKPGEKVVAPAGAPAKAADAPATPAVASVTPEAPAPAAPAPAPAAPAPATAAAAAPKSGRIRISPLARKLASEKGIDASTISGSGPGGRIVRADVLAAAAGNKVRGGGNGVPSPFVATSPLGTKGPIQEDKLVPVSNIRATIARRLVESKTQIPTSTWT